jgi:hypothetical protein
MVKPDAEEVSAGLRPAPGSGTMPVAGGLVSYMVVSSPECNGSSAKEGAKPGIAVRCVPAAKPENKLN